MDGDGRELEYERGRLALVIGVAREQLRAVQREGAELGAELRESRREMREQAQQMFGNLWGAQDFEALSSLNQFAQPLRVRQASREMQLERARQLQGALDAPYFARVDFTFDDGKDTERVYIGRAMLRDERTREMLVHDWRAPIAGVFYRFGTGRAHYDAPGGRIDGEVVLKRQFEIHRGELEYFFDADVQVDDGFLRGMLAKSASPRMKAIVETIQRDQDIAIRDMEHELLMVQGAAGSGKSSIALHRVAYLMYEGLTAKLSPGEILILSPNALFERYIHGVLPELGERSVKTVTLERLLSKSLGGARVESRGERFERLCLADSPRDKALMRASMAFKSSRAFAELLERFVRDVPRRWIGFQDVCYGGETVATKQQLKARMLRSDGKTPLGARLLRMEQSLWEGVHRRRPARMRKLSEYARRSRRHELEIDACARAYSILECAALSRHIRGITRLDARALYRRLMSDERALRGLAAGLPLPANLSEILDRTREALAGKVLPLEDAAAIAYLRLVMEGSNPSARIRQVVVDEAQDCDPMQFMVLNRLFPRARFTVLGDVNQSLDRAVDRSLYAQVSGILNRPSEALVELDKSFRCTREILDFSLRFLDDPGDIRSFNRSGDAPGEMAAQDPAEMARMIAAELAVCRDRGMKSVALIAKTARAARAWHARLGKELGVALIDSEDAGEPTGAFVIPLHLSKGLEFDAVIVLDANRYEGEDGRLLYVACTRALHRLHLFSLVEREEGGSA